MKNISVALAYHSGFGHTQRIADAIAEGVSENKGATATLINVTTINDNDWATLDNADAIVFGSPTYMGTTSPEFAQFSKESSAAWYQRKWVNKIAGGFTASSTLAGDKSNTFNVLMTLANQHGMIWVSQSHLPESNDPTGLNRLGFYAGAVAQFGNDDAPDDIAKGDLVTAINYGRRVAEAAATFAHGRA